MKRTPFMRLLAVGAAVALLAACGSGGGDSDESGDTVTITGFASGMAMRR